MTISRQIPLIHIPRFSFSNLDEQELLSLPFNQFHPISSKNLQSLLDEKENSSIIIKPIVITSKAFFQSISNHQLNKKSQETNYSLSVSTSYTYSYGLDLCDLLSRIFNLNHR